VVATKLTPEVVKQFLWYVQMGQSPSKAGESVGVTRSAISKRRERHPQFDLAVTQAVAKFEAGLIVQVQKSVQAGDGRLALEVLARRFPDEWGRSEVRLATPTASPTAVADLEMWRSASATMPFLAPVATPPQPAPAPVAASAASDDSSAEEPAT
jgi:hypothetical protein